MKYATPLVPQRPERSAQRARRRRVRKDQAGCGAEQRQHARFGDKLAQQAHASGAERVQDRDLVTPVPRDAMPSGGA